MARFAAFNWLGRMSIVGLMATSALTSCAVDSGPQTSLVYDGIEAVSLAEGADGSLLIAQRESGRILRITHEALSRRVAPGDIESIAEVEVASVGQRGLLGIAEVDGRVYAAWTRPDEQLVVGEVSPATRPVWDGYLSKAGANGGRLVVDPNGQLIIGVGTLRDSSLLNDPDAPNGKLLRLDPLGPPTQTPLVVSAGWNNPFALAYADGDHLWVADNHPSDGDEPLVRADRDASLTILPNDSAATGLASIDDRLYVCTWNTRSLLRYVIEPSGQAERAGTIATDCLRDVVAIDGRLFYAADTTINVVDTPR